ncbi:LysE family translocator [Qingshengfaniella alkalisoli]|nr:LysE family translocator [Qingshengfaniella alkalisoli]
MTIDTLFALMALLFTAAFTPGPNNALLANSGATFGLGRTVPHILGVALGFSLMLFIVGFMLGGLFQASVLLQNLLKWGGILVLLWLAWKIASAGGLTGKSGRPRPFTFVEAAAFQWINPKAWVMAIAVTTQFVLVDAPLQSAVIVAAVSVAAGLTSASSWAVLGQYLTRWLNTPERLRAFNILMGALIAGCVLFLLKA